MVDPTALAERLVAVPGVVGVMLGGSRAAGTARPGSDTDLGLYYRGSVGGIDTGALRSLVRQVAGPDAEVTQHGGWGPWVDGGGWLDIPAAGGAIGSVAADGSDGPATHRVDVLYRDLDRVEACWADSVEGRYAVGVQTGHPLGFPGFAYPGELALGRVLADPTGILRTLHERYRSYPPALADAVVGGLDEAEFLLGGVAKAAARGDHAYLALCLSRVVLLAAHAVCARAGRWVVNEKGLVEVAAAQPTAPPGFADDVERVLATSTSDGPAAVRRTRTLLDRVRTATAAPG